MILEFTQFGFAPTAFRVEDVRGVFIRRALSETTKAHTPGLIARWLGLKPRSAITRTVENARIILKFGKDHHYTLCMKEGEPAEVQNKDVEAVYQYVVDAMKASQNLVGHPRETRMRDMLLLASETFQRYAEGHFMKGTPEGNQKGVANGDLSVKCREAAGL